MATPDDEQLARASDSIDLVEIAEKAGLASHFSMCLMLDAIKALRDLAEEQHHRIRELERHIL